MPHIFISYAKKDTRQLAENLYHALNAVPGLTAWMDMSLEADESWTQRIMHEIDRCDYLVVLLSPDVNRPVTDIQKRSYVLSELDFAQQPKVDKPILPVMAILTRQPVQVAGIQYIDLTRTPTDPTRVVERVKKRFGLLTATQPTPIPTPTTVPVTAPRPPANRFLWLSGLLIGLLALVAVGIALLNREIPPTPTPTTAAALITSNTPPPLETASDPSTQIWLDFTRTAESYTATPTPTPTATSTPTATANATETYEAALEIARLTLTAQVALIPATSNDNWTPVTQDFDGVIMVLVPVGCFDMGSEDGATDEQPITRQCFDQPFWIDRTEVTQVDFERIGGQKTNPNDFDGDQRPVERITWFEARDFCALRGMRLPTEREWEYAARGPNNLTYPWGNDWNPENAVWRDNSGSQTANVGSRPDGMSWVGALDLSGNVWEWVSSLYLPYASEEDREADTRERTDVLRILRGGSWHLTSISLRAPYRFRFSPLSWLNPFGFRCARDYDAP